MPLGHAGRVVARLALDDAPEHLVLFRRVERQPPLQHREQQHAERPPVDGEVVGLGLRETPRRDAAAAAEAVLRKQDGDSEGGSESVSTAPLKDAKRR